MTPSELRQVLQLQNELERVNAVIINLIEDTGTNMVQVPTGDGEFIYVNKDRFIEVLDHRQGELINLLARLGVQQERPNLSRGPELIDGVAEVLEAA